MKLITKVTILSISIFAAFVPNSVNALSITNGSFETGTDPGSQLFLPSVNTTDIPNWSVTSGSVDYIRTLWSASDGFRSIDLSGAGAGTLSTTLTIGNGDLGFRQDILFDLSANLFGGNPIKQLQVNVSGFATTGFSTVSGQGYTGSFNIPYVTNVYSFIPTSTGNLTLTFISQENNLFGPILDNVRAQSTPVPFEFSPAIGLGVLGSVWLVRKTLKKKSEKV